MRIALTGGAGFIGSHLVDLLASRGAELTILAQPGTRWASEPGRSVRVVEGDVRDPAKVAEAVSGASIVFHLAARTDLAGRDLADYDVNVAGTRCVIEAARRCRAERLVFFSSMLAVGLAGSDRVVDESESAPADSLYGESKRIGEGMIRQSGVPFTIVRPTLVYGPRERSTMRAFFNAVSRRQFALIGPDVLQSFVYVKNLVMGAADAAVSEGAAGKTFFLSDSRPYTLAEFSRAAAQAFGVRLLPVRVPRALALAVGGACDLAARVLGHELPLSIRRVRTMTTPYVYSIESARKSFSYDPPFDLARGVEETAAWYRSHGWG